MRRIARHLALALAALASVAATSVAPVRASSDLDTTGGGEFAIFLSYTQAPNTVLGVGCQPTAFTVSGGSQLLVVSVTSVTTTGVYQYNGPVSISGSGSSTCEDAAEALSGSMTLAMSSVNGVDGLSCPSLAGAYVRAGLATLVEWQGTCTLQGLSFPVSFIGGAVYEPLQGNGVLTPVTYASLIGALHITA
jgi:hypothetical protein